MQIPPLSVLASYPTPNYVNPETKGAGLLTCNCILFSVSSVVVGIRIYTRVCLSRSFGADDFFILLAMLWAVGITALSAISYAKFGGARHVWDVQFSSFPTIIKLSLASSILFSTAVTFVKISMLLLTRKIMGTGNKALRNIIIFAIAFVTAGNIVFTLVTIFQCKPISAQWTLSFKPQNCINSQAHVLAASVINVITDFLVVLIPIPVFLRLNLKRRQRFIVIALFSAGFMVCIVGIVRIFYWQVFTDGSTDVTWDAWPVFISGSVELHVGIICSSVPATRAFFTLHTPKFLSVTSATESEGKSFHSSRSRAHPYRIFGRDAEKGSSVSDRSDRSSGGKIIRPPGAIKVDNYVEYPVAKKTPGSQAVDLNKSLPPLVISSVKLRDEMIPKVWRGGKGSRG